MTLETLGAAALRERVTAASSRTITRAIPITKTVEVLTSVERRHRWSRAANLTAVKNEAALGIDPHEIVDDTLDARNIFGSHA